MKSQATTSKPPNHTWWRHILVGVLVAIGLVSLVGFSVAHWVERQLLTTDNWVKIVGPLPRNNEVASTISSYSVDTFFKSADISGKISQALPPKADFLVPTLTSQLQTRITNRVTQFIKSDTFNNLWTTVNQKAHQKLMVKARESKPPPPQPTKLSLALSSLKPAISKLFGSQNQSFINSGSSAAASKIGISAKIKTSIETFRTWVKAIDFLNGTLGLLALVAFVGALVWSAARRRLLIVIGCLITVMGLAELITIKAVRPTILGEVQPQFKAAVGVVYDQFIATFHRTAIVTLIIGVLLALIAFVCSRTLLGRVHFVSKLMGQISASKVGGWWRTMCQFARKYRWHLTALVFLVMLVLLAFVFNPSGQGLIRSALIFLLLVECIFLIGARTRGLPMKQR